MMFALPVPPQTRLRRLVHATIIFVVSAVWIEKTGEFINNALSVKSEISVNS